VCPDFSGVEPRPIAVDLLPVPPLDPRLIPDPFRAWLVDVAERAWVPPEYPAAAALVAAGGLIGRRLAIRPKRRDRWLVVPNLWGCAVGPPGVLKTPSVEEALRPLRRLAADALERHKEEEAAHAERVMVADARKDAAKKKLAQLARDEAGDDDLLGLARIARGFQDPPMATPRRYLVNDVTVEKLGELMAENPLGLTLFRDELTGFFKTFDKQGHESDRKFFLECWPGTGGPYQFDRISRGLVNIPSLCLAVFGTCQPGPLARYLRKSVSGEECDGFIPRFQMLVYPDQLGAFRNVDREPDAGARDAAYAVFQHLERLDLAAAGCPVDADSGIPFIGFADEAQELFDGWRVTLEDRVRSATLSGVMAAHLAKYRSLMPSLALIFHLVESYRCDPLQPVTHRAALAAAAWCDLLEAHARRVYQAASDGDPDDAIRLAERIKASLPNPFTCRIVAQKGWAGLTSVEDVRRAVGVLEDRGWLKTVEIPTTERGGRPTERIWIHPRLRDEGGWMYEVPRPVPGEKSGMSPRGCLQNRRNPGRPPGSDRREIPEYGPRGAYGTYKTGSRRFRRGFPTGILGFSRRARPIDATMAAPSAGSSGRDRRLADPAPPAMGRAQQPVRG
jgi:putative DNA primase/helicase